MITQILFPVDIVEMKVQKIRERLLAISKGWDLTSPAFMVNAKIGAFKNCVRDILLLRLK
jgi:hypothetical protein